MAPQADQVDEVAARARPTLPRHGLVVLALALALVGTLLDLPGRTVEAAPARPDVVLFYLDDNAPYPARLWNDPGRTPNLARFANAGMEFRNAIATTPMCGPARAALEAARECRPEAARDVEQVLAWLDRRESGSTETGH